jgi:predicted nucleic acid-binding Zn ribbon protein
MPTYEFRCPDGTIIERVFKMSDVPDAIPAPDGKGLAVRIISGGADLIFKGSGFYITDYGKDGKKDQRSDASKGAEQKSAGAKDAPSPAADSAAASKPKSKEPADAKSAKTESKSKPPTPPSGAAA